MSKLKLVESGGKYAGKKLVEVLKKIKRKKSTAKSKKAQERVGLGTKSLTNYKHRSSSGSGDVAAIVPVKYQTGKGSSFKTRKIKTKGQSTYHVQKMGGQGSAESLREDLMRTHGYGPSLQELLRSISKKRKALGGMLRLKRGGDNMPPRNKKNFRSTKSGAGMTAAGVAAYRRANPGSKLKTAVTGKVKPGSKDAMRRKSFCARSLGQMKKFPKAAKDPNSRLRQARRRWKC